MTPQTPPKRTAANYVYGPGAPIGYQPPSRPTNCVYGPGVPIGYQPPSRPTNCVYGPGVPIGYQPGAPITNSCNQYKHAPHCKGTTREHKTPPVKRNYCSVDRSASPFKQVTQLTNALEKAAKDGARLEAVLYRPEFGELILDCGNPSPTHPSRMDAKGHHGHGVQHALESRHHITPYTLAQTLIQGKVTQDPDHPSRIRVQNDKYRVVLEREIKVNSGRISPIKVKLHTATHISAQ